MTNYENEGVAQTASDELACINPGCPEFGASYPPALVTVTNGVPVCGTCEQAMRSVGAIATEATRTAEVDAILEKQGVSREQATGAAEPLPAGDRESNEATSLMDTISSKQLGAIGALGDIKNVDAAIECRKLMQCEVEELSKNAAEKFIRHLQDIPNPTPPADTNGNPSDADRRKEATAAAEANTGQAAQATASDLVPEFGNVLAKREPTALAYGFPPAVDALIVKAKLSPEQTSDLLGKFGNLFAQIDGWRDAVESIVIRDENDEEGIAKARKIAKAMADDRINAEKRKKLIKEPYLRPSQLIDGVFNIYIDEAAPIEKLALEKAKTKELAEQARKEKVRAERETRLTPFVENVKAFDLRPDVMTDEAFDQLLLNSKNAHEAAEADKKRKEEERQRAEDEAAAERVKIRRINDRTAELSAMGFVKDVAGERYALEDLSVFDREIENANEEAWSRIVSDIKPKAEAARVEADRKRKEGEEALRQKQEEERLRESGELEKKRAEERARFATDREKLALWVDTLDRLTATVPAMQNERTQTLVGEFKGELAGVVARFRHKIEQLP